MVPLWLPWAPGTSWSASKDLFRRTSPWLFAIVLALAFGACGGKFSPASESGDPDGGIPAGASGSGGTDGSGGSSGSAGRGGGGATDSGLPDSNPGDVRVDVPVAPLVPLSGLILWLRADAGISRDVDSVTEWADQSSAGSDATQSVLDLRPRLLSAGAGIGGIPSVEFDGADDFLTLPSGFGDFTDGISIFVVALLHTTDQCSAMLQFSNGSEVDDITLGQYNGQVLYEVADEYFGGEAFPVGSAQLFALVHAPDGAFVLRRNGRPSSEGMSMLPAEIERTQNSVGNNNYSGCQTFPGLIAEVLIYDRAVANDELFTIERYLRDRSDIR